MTEEESESRTAEFPVPDGYTARKYREFRRLIRFLHCPVCTKKTPDKKFVTSQM